jgi:tRNA-guanine family transglycosylase
LNTRFATAPAIPTPRQKLKGICHRRQGAGGRMFTPHGVIDTPVFVPVERWRPSRPVAGLLLEELGIQILLNNTHHLYLRSGVEMVRSLGGVQRFMAWDKAILTDETAKRGVVPAPYFFGRDSGGTNPATR